MTEKSRPRHKHYSPRDSKKIMIAFFLSEGERLEDGATVENIQNCFTKICWTTKYDDIKGIMEEMVEFKWVIYVPSRYYKNKGAYKMSPEGLYAIDTIRKLVHEENPLLGLQVFNDLRSRLHNEPISFPISYNTQY